MPDARNEGDLPLVLVSGLSGAGRSTALRALEDEGYEAVDNLPMSLLDTLITAETQPPHGLAMAVDVRSRNFDASAFVAIVERLRKRPGVALKLIFLDSDTDVLQRRYTETRRTHPLAGERSVTASIELERGLMAVVRHAADLVIDTSDLSGADLKRIIVGQLALQDSARLGLFVTSFSYRQGLPRNADLVFDVRFLANPHYVEDLNPLTGRDEPVGAFIEQDPSFQPFFDRLGGLLADLLPAYEREGKYYLTIAIGCTGGQHRSVFVAERLAALLSEGHRVHLEHRDLASALARNRDANKNSDAS
ncbi:MAG: RNase adapter RapZ [Pseudomonadota bacterium]